MHNVELIFTLTAGLAAALLLGFLALRIKLPPIVGYLVAGIVIGPHTPGFIANRHLAEQLAEVGVILLMFGVGLHFHIKDLLAVRRIALTGAVFQSLVATALGAVVAHSMGWSWAAGIVFGLTLSVASTVVLMRVLSDHRDLHTRTGRIAVGWLVVEDIFTVFVLVVLPAVFARQGRTSESLPLALGLAALKLAVLSALTLGPGARLIPRLLAMVARTNSRELFTLTVLVVALGLAVGSATLFGVSMALGAFLAGMVVGQSEFSSRAASEALPMRDAFAVLFFVSVGMLFNPGDLVNSPGLIAAAVGIVLLGKPLAALVIVQVLGFGFRIGLRVAVALAQVGEFSFMLAVLGTQLGVLPEGATGAVVAAAILTITINPLLYRAIPAVERKVMRSRFARYLEPRARGAEKVGTANHDGDLPALHAVVVGYGPVGETVATLLADLEVTPVIVELNIDTVRRLEKQGLRAVYGDAAQRDVLEKAGISDAVALVLSSPGEAESAEIFRSAREMNPEIKVLARSQFVSQTPALLRSGADAVFSAEAEVATAIVDAVLRNLGATPEQMDQERARARETLYRRTQPRSAAPPV